MTKILTLFFLLYSTVVFSQIDSNCWINSESNSCLEFDKKSQRVNVNAFYSNYKTNEQRFEYSINDDKLKIIWYHDPGTFGFMKSFIEYKFKIFENQLILELVKNKKTDDALFELFGGKKLVYNQSKQETCSLKIMTDEK